MKTRILLLIAVILVGGLVGTLMQRDPGYLLLAYDGAAMETSLWFGMVLLAIVYAVVRITLFLFGRLIHGKGILAAWSKNRRVQISMRDTARGLLLLEEGNWLQAKKLLTGAVASAAAPAVNYLAAARAAHELGAADERDELLRRARESSPEVAVAASLSEVSMLMAAEEWKQALVMLLQLREGAPKHPLVAMRLLRCCEAMQDWRQLADLVVAVRKAKVMDRQALEELEVKAWRGLLAASGLEAWRQLPKGLKSDPELVQAAVEGMQAADDTAAAEKLLREALNSAWRSELVRLYGCLRSPVPEKQLARAEAWLQERPNDGELLLAAGRLALMNAQWSRAREFMEAAWRVEPTALVQAELGRLLCSLGESSRGNELLVKSATGLPELPLPQRTG